MYVKTKSCLKLFKGSTRNLTIYNFLFQTTKTQLLKYTIWTFFNLVCAGKLSDKYVEAVIPGLLKHLKNPVANINTIHIATWTLSKIVDLNDEFGHLIATNQEYCTIVPRILQLLNMHSIKDFDYLLSPTLDAFLNIEDLLKFAIIAIEGENDDEEVEFAKIRQQCSLEKLNKQEQQAVLFKTICNHMVAQIQSIHRSAFGILRTLAAGSDEMAQTLLDCPTFVPTIVNIITRREQLKDSKTSAAHEIEVLELEDNSDYIEQLEMKRDSFGIICNICMGTETQRDFILNAPFIKTSILSVASNSLIKQYIAVDKQDSENETEAMKIKTRVLEEQYKMKQEAIECIFEAIDHYSCHQEEIETWVKAGVIKTIGACLTYKLTSITNTDFLIRSLHCIGKVLEVRNTSGDKAKTCTF